MHIEPFVEASLKESDAWKLARPYHFLGDVVFNKMHMWVAHDGVNPPVAVALTRFIDWYTGYRSLFIPIVGGKNLRQWINPMLDALERFRIETKCQDMRGEFRKGWARAAGFKITGVTLVRDGS